MTFFDWGWRVAGAVCLIALTGGDRAWCCGTHNHDGQGEHSHAESGCACHADGGVQVLSNASSAGGAAPFTFAVVADTQGNPGARDFVAQLAADIDAQAPDLVIFPGDLVGTGSVATYAEWDAATAVLGDRRYMVPGNHDLPGRPATNEDWQTSFSWLPDSQSVPDVTTDDPLDSIRGVDKMDYYFDVGDSRFISVATDRDAVAGESGDVLGGVPRALDWFQSVMSLESTRQKSHLFVFTHHPVTTEPFDGNGGTGGEWWRSLAGTNEDLDTPAATALMAGHWHFYQPSRPDPESDTLELVQGTGGGGFEGGPQDNFHGFSLITVDGPTVTAKFIGDSDGSAGGWRFDDVLDEYVVTESAGVPRGELARYSFELGQAVLDSSDSPLSKGHALNLNGSAFATNEAQRDDVLRLVGGYADAKATGEGNLAVVGDLTLSLQAKAADLGAGIDNVLIAFGDADDAANGSAGETEAANYAYHLSYTEQGRLRFAWEHGVQTLEEVFSPIPVDDPFQWRSLEVRRDAELQTVAFYVDGELLGSPVSYEHNASGAGAGSLYLGAEPDGAANFLGWIDEVIVSSAAVTVLFGDLDQDGDIDLDDWRAILDGFGEPLTGASSDYVLGDLDLNGLRDLSDLAAFRRSFERANGTTIEIAMAQQAVPEPGGAVLFAIACSSLIDWQHLVRRRQR